MGVRIGQRLVRRAVVAGAEGPTCRAPRMCQGIVGPVIFLGEASHLIKKTQSLGRTPEKEGAEHLSECEGKDL